MKKYVVGALFNDDGSEIALILKNRPDFLKGKLNFIGGHIEDYDETPLAAMNREGREEAGVEPNWKFVYKETGDNYVLYYFTAFSTDAYNNASTMTDETIVKCLTDNLPADAIELTSEFIDYILNNK